MRVLVTGSSGYIGSVLMPKLRAAGHVVRGLDLGWFGLRNEDWCIDVRQMPEIENCDAVIHLAAVANDPGCELDGRLGWETNALGTMWLAEIAAECGVKQFIYASSGSVYGVSDSPKVTEDTPLNPISDYNKTKMVAERCLLSYADKMAIKIIRPATVCGYSPRMRLDTVVNRYTMQAMQWGVIEVWGGEQIRPHLHIDDMTDLYVWLLGQPQSGTWNASCANLSLNGLAALVSAETGAAIVRKESNDPRSYRLDSSKLERLGFETKKTVLDAIREVKAKIESGELKDEPIHYNLKQMKELGFGLPNKA